MKYALVTGGSRGIGRAISLKLAEMGYTILINYLTNETEAAKTLQMIQENGGDGQLMKFNVANPEDVDNVLCAWMDENKDSYIDVLVNNSGIRKDTLLMWMQNSDWTEVMDTNLNGYFYVTRRLIKDMMIRKHGRIINIVSLSGIKGLPGQMNYSASKAGVIGATKALAQEVGKKNVTVNAVAPGFISTDMIKDLDEKAFKDMIPLSRFGKPEEVADLVAFLASDKAGYITGQVISINGGLYT